MVTLTRTISIYPALERTPNSLSGDELAAEIVVRITVSGELDSKTGCICNVTCLDQFVVQSVKPVLDQQMRRGASRSTAEHTLFAACEALATALPTELTLIRLELQPNTSVAYTIHTGASNMVSVTRKYEFSAAHRLCSPDWDDKQNAAVFGKCSNPFGHGHNYILEVTVTGEPDEQTGAVLPVNQIDVVVNDCVVGYFDHRHLNEECPEFSKLNPSMENIARIIWDRLCGRFQTAVLTSVRVHENSRSCAEYAGQ